MSNLQTIITLENSEGILKEFIIDKFDAISSLNLSTKVAQCFGGFIGNGELKLQNIDLELWSNLIPKLLQKTKMSTGSDSMQLNENIIAQEFMNDLNMLDKLAEEVAKFNGFFDRFGLGSIPELLNLMRLNYSLQTEYQKVTVARENLLYSVETDNMKKDKKNQKLLKEVAAIQST